MRRRWDAREMRWMDSDGSLAPGHGVRREFRSGQPDRAETFREQTVQAARAVPGLRPGAPGARRDELHGAEGLHRHGSRTPGTRSGSTSSTSTRRSPFPWPTPSWCSSGIPFALQSPRGGRVIGIALCLALGLGYFIVHSAAVALARTEHPPAAGRGLVGERAVRHARALPVSPRANLRAAGRTGPRRASVAHVGSASGDLGATRRRPCASGR